jgi:hypothetical protein
MRVSFLPPSFAGLGVALCLAAPASAATIPLSPAPPASSFTFNIEGDSFMNYYTFTLTKSEDLGASDTLTFVSTTKFTSGDLELFKGTPTSGTKVSSDAMTGSSTSASGSLTDVLLAGKYYYEVAVTAKGPLANTLAVAGIPEVQTWAMLGIGFAALGLVGFAKGKGERRFFLD